MNNLTLVTLGVAGAFAVAIGIQTLNSQKTVSNVGTRPGDIGKSTDIYKTARDRNNDLALFAAGCFWHVEDDFRKTSGVIATAVGYSGGETKNPTYEIVCSHTTTHREVVLVEFDPNKITYKQLVEKFFGIHNPCQADGQGPDIGEQYKSAVYYFTREQEKIAQVVRDEIQRSGKMPGQIATQILPAKPFYLAEEYHQQYYEKNGGGGGLCPIR